MFFLLRLAFWVMLICLLLPGSHEDNRRLITSAEQTVNDVRGFCQRNPQVCDDMRMSMTTLLSRFRSGAELLQTWLAQQGGESEGHGTTAERGTTTGRQGRSDASPQPVTKWQDGLSSSDKQLPWRGPTTF
jgi:hypothetical protein